MSYQTLQCVLCRRNTVLRDSASVQDRAVCQRQNLSFSHRSLCCTRILPTVVFHKGRKSCIGEDHLSAPLDFHTVASLWSRISTTYFRPQMIYSCFKKPRNSVQSSLIHRFLKSRHPFLTGLHNKLFPEWMTSDERCQDEGCDEGGI